MDDLRDRLRSVNPYPDKPKTAPLDARAEADLAALISQTPSDLPGQPEVRYLRQRRRWLVPLTAAAAAAAIFIGVGLTAEANRAEELTVLAASSVARPVVSSMPETGNESKEEALEAVLRSAAADSSPETSSYVNVTHWELGTMWDAAAQEFTHDISLPMTYQVSPGPEGSLKQKISAGNPLSESGDLPALEDLATSGPGLMPGESEVNTYPADEFQVMFTTAPPATSEDMLAYLTDIQVGNTAAFADGEQGLLQAAGMMLNSWHLGPEANTALLKMVEADPNIEYTGTVTDRDGRVVQTYSVQTQRDGLFRTSLLVDAKTGRVSGYEESYLEGPDTGKSLFPAGSVLRYIQVHQPEPSAT